MVLSISEGSGRHKPENPGPVKGKRPRQSRRHSQTRACFAARHCRTSQLGWLAMSAVTEVGGTPVPDNLPDVFGEFCAAGLWPGLGRKMAGQLAGAGITGPALVTAERLELIDGVSGDRAAWLAAAFAGARPCYETAQLLAACQVPARFAGPAVAMLGRTARDQLREDPWRLLALPQIRPDQADWFARKLLGSQASPQDPAARRGPGELPADPGGAGWAYRGARRGDRRRPGPVPDRGSGGRHRRRGGRRRRAAVRGGPWRGPRPRRR